jgi:hypothetical protein
VRRCHQCGQEIADGAVTTVLTTTGEAPFHATCAIRAIAVRRRYALVVLVAFFAGAAGAYLGFGSRGWAAGLAFLGISGAHRVYSQYRVQPKR